MAVMMKEGEYKPFEENWINFKRISTGEVEWGFPLLNGPGANPVPCVKSSEGVYIPCQEDDCPWWSNYRRISEDTSFLMESETITRTYWEPPVLLCDCGEQMVLACNTQECRGCGKVYDRKGRERGSW